MAQASQWTHSASLDSSAVANSYPMDEIPLKGQVLRIQPHPGGRSRILGAGLSPVEALAKGKWQGDWNYHLAVGGQSPAVRAQERGYRCQENRVQDPEVLGADPM